ncbi:acyl carrier protein [Streptomyces sp. HUAS TT20]|uniref:acyl carrier protein n=1 Tax=Streptomyces sp. HUAS TT20 TaxID=3447509 RepID=UPI0021D99121|nr:acyl carrier protein [Streptomyces sp. HUAS 15-9]UXY30504.1 acyl carrier protein [Streptomyces sp. HUAS 15-9]
MNVPSTRQSGFPAPGAQHDVPQRGWLLDRVALYLGREAATIDPTVPLAEYGMDSVCALSLCGDLEDEFGLVVEPTLLWDHPTVQSLLGFLAAELTVADARGER